MSRNTNVDAGDDATKTDTSIHARQVWERGALAAMKWKASASAKKSDSSKDVPCKTAVERAEVPP